MPIIKIIGGKKPKQQNVKKRDPFYGSAIWRELRKRLKKERPWCEYCIDEGVLNPPKMEVADHVRPKNLFPEMATLYDNLKPSCSKHHNRKRAIEKQCKTREQFEQRARKEGWI